LYPFRRYFDATRPTKGLRSQYFSTENRFGRLLA
jgi:hypothetical protein